MISKNKTVNKAHEVIKTRIEKLRERKQNLRDRIEDRYPFEVYGVRSQSIYEQKSKELDDEIKLLKKYDSGIYDLIEIIEGKSA